MAKQDIQGTVAEGLKALGVKGVLIQMAEHEQIVGAEVRNADVFLPGGATQLPASPSQDSLPCVGPER